VFSLEFLLKIFIGYLCNVFYFYKNLGKM